MEVVEKKVDAQVATGKKSKKSKHKPQTPLLAENLNEEDDAEDEVKDFDIDDFNSGYDENNEDKDASSSQSDNCEEENESMDNSSDESDDSASS